MADDLDRLMDFTEGEGPSPEFVTTLRRRIVAETTSPKPVDDNFVVELEVGPVAAEHTTSRPRWLLVGVAAAAIALFAGYTLLSGQGPNGELETINPADGSSTTTTVATTTTAPPASFVSDAVPVTEEFTLLDPGTYRVDTLGTPFTFTIDEPQAIQPNSLGHLVLSHPGSQSSVDRSLTFMRLTALTDPARPASPLEDLGDGWPADDFTGWLDNLSDKIVISNRQDTTVGGLDAVRVELELGDTDCQLGVACLPFGTNRLVRTKWLHPGAKYRIWIVDQADEDPLVVIAGIDREAERGWFETADAILAALAFGDVAPNPILDLPAGPAELPFLGGIRTDLPQESFAMRDPRGFDTVVLLDWPGDTKFLVDPVDAAGNAVETTDELLAALQAADVVVTEIESTAIEGIDARVFDIAGTATSPALWLASGPETAWHSPVQGRVWVVDHPERGLLMITAEASELIDIVFPLTLAQTEQIIGSLEFIEQG